MRAKDVFLIDFLFSPFLLLLQDLSGNEGEIKAMRWVDVAITAIDGW